MESPDGDYVSQVQEASALTMKEIAEPDIVPRVNEMLDRLSPTFREPLALVANGFTYAEVGQALQIAPNTVRSRIQHARKHAARMLADFR